MGSCGGAALFNSCCDVKLGWNACFLLFCDESKSLVVFLKMIPFGRNPLYMAGFLFFARAPVCFLVFAPSFYDQVLLLCLTSGWEFSNCNQILTMISVYQYTNMSMCILPCGNLLALPVEFLRARRKKLVSAFLCTDTLMY